MRIRSVFTIPQNTLTVEMCEGEETVKSAMGELVIIGKWLPLPEEETIEDAVVQIKEELDEEGSIFIEMEDGDFYILMPDLAAKTIVKIEVDRE